MEGDFIMNINSKSIDFNEVAERVKTITDTAENTIITKDNYQLVPTIDKFSEYGLISMGKTVGFPAPFVQELSLSNEPLANTIIKDRVEHYFKTAHPAFCERSFFGKVTGVVSNRYNYFDDDQVIEILDGSPLTEMAFQNAIITPERLHLRAIDTEHPFTLANDESELYFAYFIDNSMVGQSAFRVQIGIFRLACTNGMIVSLNQFTLCRQIHRGMKDIAAEFNENVAFLSEKQEDIRQMITTYSKEPATIEAMKQDFHEDYLAKKLNLNKSESQKVLYLYKTTYDGRSKWGMANAISEFARDIKDINRREYLEKRAFLVA